MLASLVYNVNDTTDTFNGSTSLFLGFTPSPLNDGKLSLREAIYLANQAAAGDDVTINLASNATYNLSRTPPAVESSFGVFQDYLVGDLDIRHQVTINGNGAKIDAKGISRVLEIRGSFPVELNSLTITGGRATGSERTVGGGGVAVFGGANVTLQGVTVTDNRVSFGAVRNDTNGAGAYGGGLYVDNAGGTITINASTFSNNQSLGQAGGLADDNDDGGDGGAGWGGGVFVHQGSVVVTGSGFRNNRAIGGAGGEADDDPAIGGDGGDSNGGAIAVGAGTLTVTNSTFVDNRAGAGNTTGGRSPDVGGRGGGAAGGAIYLTDFASANIQKSTFTKNIANASTGGFGDNRGGDGGRAIGGAILAGSNTLNLQDTSFNENAALGGLGGRSFGDGGDGGAARGGAIFSKAGGTWTGDTFTRNRAVGGAGNRPNLEGRGGSGGDATGGGIYIEAPLNSTTGAPVPIQLTLTNPVFTGNEANAGNGDRGTGDNGVGGRGGLAGGGAFSSNFPVTLLVNVDIDGPHFSENNARGGTGGNSFRSRMGDGGAALGGAIFSPGAPVTLTGLADKPLSFVGNSAIAGSAASASYAEPPGGATPGRGGDASGGAIYAGAGLTADFVGLMANITMSGRGTDGMASAILPGTYRINDPDTGPQVKNPAVASRGLAAGDSGRSQGGAMWANGTVDIAVGVFLDNRAYGGRADDGTTFVGGRGGQDVDGLGQAGGRGGDAQGGALFVTGNSLLLADSLLAGNQAAAGPGGAGGSSLLTQDRVEGNTLFVVPSGQPGGSGGRGGDASGGALHAVVNGTALVTQTVFRENQAIAGRGGAGGPGAIGGTDAQAHGGAAGAGGEAQGGSVALAGGNAGSATMTDVIIDRSTVVGGDGGLGAPGGTNGNGGRGGDGGAATGGGLAISGPTVSSVTSTVSENVTSAGWGGSGGNGGFGGEAGGNGGNGGNAGQSRGGGIGVTSGQLNLDRSTVFGNLALAGCGGQGGNGGNSNLLGGRGGNSGSGGEALGGGVWIGYNATPGSIHASTIVSNGVEAGGTGFVGEGGNVPRADGAFPIRRATSADPKLTLAFGSAAVLAAGQQDVRGAVLSVSTNHDLPVDPVVLSITGIPLLAAGVFTGTAFGIGTFFLIGGSTVLPAVAFGAVGPGTAATAIATITGGTVTSLAVLAPVVIVALPIVIVGGVVIASFVLGDGDFIDGLEQVASRFTLDAADQPKYSLGQLFSAGEVEDPDAQPVPQDGVAGSKGTAGKAEGPNFFAVQFNPDNPLQMPHVTPQATFDRTVLADGKAVTRERVRHLPDERAPITLFESQPYLMREVVHVFENPADLAGAPVASSGHNFVGVAAAGFTSTGDQKGTAAAPLDLKSVGFLQIETGARTPTLRLQPDSPARDAGPVLAAGETAQNGFDWQAGTQPEIGAWGAGENRAPVANDFTIIIKQGEPIEIQLSDLLPKTSDPDGDLRRLSFVDTTLGTNGVLNLSVGSTDRRLDTLAGQVIIPSTVTSIDLSGTGNVPLFGEVARIPLFAGDAAAASADPRVISFTPKDDFVGVTEFPFRFTDGVLESNTGVLRIEVGDVNSRPNFTAGNVHVDKDSGPRTIANWVTAFDPGGPEETAQQPLAYSVTNVGDPSLFAVAPAIATNGTLTFTPAAGVQGETTITVTLQDDGGTANGGLDTSLPQTFNIRIGNSNRQPAFTASPLPAINEDAGPRTIANWASFDPGDPSETAQQPTYLISNVSNAALFSVPPTVAADGTLTYTPTADANGSSTFIVRVQDDGGTAFGGVDTSAPQTFTVTVNPVNDAPTFTASFADNQVAAVVINPFGCCKDFEFPAFVRNSSAGPANESGQSLVRYTVQQLDSLPQQTVTIDNAGKLTANLTYELEGAVRFRVIAEDNGGTANGGVNSSTSQIYTILVTRFGTLNAPPSVTAPALTARPEDAGAVSVPGWAQFHQGVDAFANGAVARYIVSNISNASLFSTPPAVANNGTLTFTSAPNAFGTATFDLQVQDNHGTQNGGVDTSGAKQFTITITPQNDRPSFTAPAVTEVNEDAGLVVISDWVTSFDTGPNEAHQQVRNYVAVAENFTIHEASFDLFAERPTISNNGELRFRVKPNVFGDLHFKAAVVDNGGPGFFPDPININQSNLQSFVVRVLPVNDAPRYVGPTELTIAETAIPQRLESFAAAVPGQDNEAGQAVVEYRITANDNEAMFAELPKIDIAGTLTFTLKPNAFGTANVTFVVQDNGGTDRGGVDTSAPATITITATDVDDTPIVGEITAPSSIAAGASVPLHIDASVRTGDNSALTFDWTVTSPSDTSLVVAGHEFVFNPTEPGPHEVQATVTSPGGEVTRNVVIDVLPSKPNLNSLAVPSLALLGQVIVLAAAASDPLAADQAVTLAWTVTNLLSNDVQTFAGTEVRFVAAAGSYEVELTATTAVGSSASRVEQIRVLNVEVPATGIEDETTTLRVIDTAPNGAPDDLNVLWTLTPTGGDEVALLGSPATYLPLDGGDVRITTSVGDSSGGLLTVADRTLTVTAVNDAPVIDPIETQLVDEGELLTLTATAADIDSPTLTFSLGAGEPAGAAIDPTTGVFTWTPTESQGPNSYTITVCVADDGAPVLQAFTTYIVTVAEVNRSPVLTSISNKTVDEEQPLTFTVAATDPDAPGNVLTFNLDADAPTGASIAPETGVFTWTPTEAQGPGDYLLTVRVTDDGSPSLDGFVTFLVVVREVNQAPTRITLNRNGINENVPGAAIGELIVTDADDGDTHTFSVDDSRFEILGHEFRLKQAHSLIYDAAQPTVVVTITATDAGGLEFSEAIGIVVLPNPLPWRNPTDPLDTNNDGTTSPLDVLLIVNYLNQFGPGLLRTPPMQTIDAFYDVNGDGSISPIDALIIVNRLNSTQSLTESEGDAPNAVPPAAFDWPRSSELGTGGSWLVPIRRGASQASPSGEVVAAADARMKLFSESPSNRLEVTSRHTVTSRQTERFLGDAWDELERELEELRPADAHDFAFAAFGLA